MKDTRATTPPVSVSVIVTVTERPESLSELFDEYSAPLERMGVSYEFLFVAEPWHRNLTAPLKQLAARGAPLRVLETGQGVGEATLLKMAAAHCRGATIVTLPAYRRIEAAALPELVRRVQGGADIAVARRWPRNDSWVNRLQSRAFHALIAGLARGRIHDVACGVRAMRREVLQEIPLYGDFFRFLPLLALREGYGVEEVDAPQHPADSRVRIYRPGIYLRRLLDVLGLFFLLRFTEKPLRFFGLVGSLLSVSGGLVLVVLLMQRLGGQGIADRPLLLLGVLLIVLGVQAIALGLIGEIIVHLHAPRRNSYRLRRASPATGRGSASPGRYDEA
jgi:hypothetical protein